MIFFFLWLLCGVITGSIAYSKNRFWLGWFILGCIIGIFGVIWIACLPSLPSKKRHGIKREYIREEISKRSLKPSLSHFFVWWRGLSRWRRIVGYIVGALLLLFFIGLFAGDGGVQTDSNGISSSSTGEFRWTNKNENDLYINGFKDESSCQQITKPDLHVHDGVKVELLDDSGFCYQVRFLGGDYEGEKSWLLGRNLREQPNPVQEAVVEIKERMHVWTDESWTMPGHDRPVLWNTYDQCMEADEIPDREIANNIPVKVLDTPSGTELAEYECVKIRPLTGNHAGETFYIGVQHLVD